MEKEEKFFKDLKKEGSREANFGLRPIFYEVNDGTFSDEDLSYNNDFDDSSDYS